MVPIELQSKWYSTKLKWKTSFLHQECNFFSIEFFFDWIYFRAWFRILNRLLIDWSTIQFVYPFIWFIRRCLHRFYCNVLFTYWNKIVYQIYIERYIFGCKQQSVQIVNKCIKIRRNSMMTSFTSFVFFFLFKSCWTFFILNEALDQNNIFFDGNFSGSICATTKFCVLMRIRLFWNEHVQPLTW